MENILRIKNYLLPGVMICVLFNFALTGCKTDDPVKEDVPELVTKVTFTFTPTVGGTAITATATDPDGDGVQNITVDGPINLIASTAYVLTLSLINELAEPSSPEFNITDEVEEEGGEHMFFFAWTGNVFSDPTGNGNIDNRPDVVNYADEDEGGLPLGLETVWTSTVSGSGTFRVVLKHQPELKTSSSDVNTGETDLDVIFEINVN